MRMDLKTPDLSAALYHHGPAKVSRIHPEVMSAVSSAVVETAAQQCRHDRKLSAAQIAAVTT
jgi:hypothetical protein